MADWIQSFHLRDVSPNKQLDFGNKLGIFIQILGADTGILYNLSKQNQNFHYGLEANRCPTGVTTPIWRYMGSPMYTSDNTLWCGKQLPHQTLKVAIEKMEPLVYI